MVNYAKSCKNMHMIEDAFVCIEFYNFFKNFPAIGHFQCHSMWNILQQTDWLELDRSVCFSENLHWNTHEIKIRDESIVNGANAHTEICNKAIFQRSLMLSLNVRKSVS